MAITAADLLQPKGDAAPSWFPTLDADGVTALLGAYIDDATSKIPATVTDGDDVDNATRAWAMVRAVRNVLMRLAITPASATLEGQGSQTITSEQLKTFKEMEAKYLDQFDAITVDTTATIDPAESGSASLANDYRW